MCYKQSIKYFLSGFFSVFRFGVLSFRQTSNLDITEYVDFVEKDMNIAFEQLKKYNERN